MQYRVLVTGANGFVGRHVCEALTKRGHAVYGMDLNCKTGEKIAGGIPVICGCVGNGFDMRDALQFTQCDAIVHLAAKVSVEDSGINPSRYIEANSAKTGRMLHWLKEARNLRKIVVASSMSVYGDCDHERASESHPCCPASIYGMTKLDQERYCLLYGKQRDIDVIALRLFNVYGPGQDGANRLTGVLANWADDILNGKQPEVCDDGNQTRDFVYVTEVARAFADAVDARIESAVINIGTGVATTLLRAAENLAKALYRDIKPNVSGRRRFGDVRHCVADTEQARRLLGWTPNVGFDAGLHLYAKHLLTR